MLRILRYAVIAVLFLIAAAVAYGAKGYFDALTDSDRLADRARRLIAEGRSGDALGAEHLAAVVAVQDPAFETHSGIDFVTPGAGMTTISQSVSKRLAFDAFAPGIGKIRQTGYALGLEARLDKAEILALWLDTLEMGRGPNGWMTGFFTASRTIYGRPPADLSRAEMLSLVAVLIAPSAYDLTAGDDPRLAERVARIERLLSGRCVPDGHGDVWLDGCAAPSRT